MLLSFSDFLMFKQMFLDYKAVSNFTVKSDVLFPAILQHCRQYCNVHAVIAPSKLLRKLQVAAMSISSKFVDLNIFKMHIFCDKNTAKH